MSLITPSIPNFIPFDATSNYTLNFTVGNNSGDQVVANRIVIRKNSDNTLVYYNEVANFLYTHLIPANTLQNNTQYKVSVSTKNSSGTYSTASDWVLFYCYAPQVITINVSEGATINNSTYTFTGTYTGTDTIKSFRFLLYDSNETLLESYDEVISSTITQTVTGLQNNTSYHIELLTTSQSNVEVTTGLIGFTVSYIAPVINSNLVLTNVPTTGSVQIDINAIEVTGIGSGQTYISDDWVDVSTTGAYVYFDQRLNLIVSDFTLRLHFYNIPSDTVFCTITGDSGTLTIKYYDNRFHVFKSANGLMSHFVNDTDIELEGNYDDESLIDDTNSLVDTYIFDDTQSVSILIDYTLDTSIMDKVCLEIKSINNLIDVTAELYA